MPTKRSILVLSLLSIATSGTAFGAVSESARSSEERGGFERRADEPYRFIIRPGTPTWNSFETHDEMVVATQVPESVLETLSTDSLIETILDYPLLGDVFAYDEPQKGFQAISAQFNALQALLKRSDAGVTLLEKYQQMDPTRAANIRTLLEQGTFTASLSFVEVTLAQEVILESLNPAERHALLAEALTKSEDKRALPDVFGRFSQEKTALLMGRVLWKERQESFVSAVREDHDLKEFLRTGALANEAVLDRINSEARNRLDH